MIYFFDHAYLYYSCYSNSCTFCPEFLSETDSDMQSEPSDAESELSDSDFEIDEVQYSNHNHFGYELLILIMYIHYNYCCLSYR